MDSLGLNRVEHGVTGITGHSPDLISFSLAGGELKLKLKDIFHLTLSVLLSLFSYILTTLLSHCLCLCLAHAFSSVILLSIRSPPAPHPAVYVAPTLVYQMRHSRHAVTPIRSRRAQIPHRHRSVHHLNRRVACIPGRSVNWKSLSDHASAAKLRRVPSAPPSLICNCLAIRAVEPRYVLPVLRGKLTKANTRH